MAAVQHTLPVVDNGCSNLTTSTRIPPQERPITVRICAMDNCGSEPLERATYQNDKFLYFFKYNIS